MKTSSRRPAIASPTTSSARAVAVHLGRVDQGHAEIEAEPQRRDLVGGAAPVVAHVPGALAERRHAFAAPPGHIVQALVLLFSSRLDSANMLPDPEC